MARRKSNNGPVEIVKMIVAIGMLIGVALMVIGGFIDTADNASAPWVVALQDLTTTVSGATSWLSLLLASGFGGFVFYLVMRIFG